MIKKRIDKENHFISWFNPDMGSYVRTGVIENGKDTGIDPFMGSFPELLDIGIMATCACAGKCNVDCYQDALHRTGKNMSCEDFRSILEQCKGNTYQIALGGAGDPDTHENFEEILKLCAEYEIVPNFTTSGIAFTKEKAELCKKYCGAVAVSEHFADYTDKAVGLLLNAGVKTNLHYVVSKKSIGYAIECLRKGVFREGINAVVFLMYKPVGLGRTENVLTCDDKEVQEFFSLIDNANLKHKIGFDSCSCPGIINFAKDIDMNSIDYCEGGRFSAYIDAEMNMMPCSFANQDPSWFVSLKKHSIKEIWDGDLFDKFRHSLKHSCPDCKDKAMCAGGCPLMSDIVLCKRKERSVYREDKE